MRGRTVSRAKASCVCCNSVLAPERVRAQLAAHRGGADVVFDAKGSRTGGATLLAVVTLREGQSGRHYRLPTAADYAAVWKAQQRLKEVAATKLTDGLSAIPDEPLPPIGTLGFRVQRYGMTRWGDLFTARQKIALHTFQNSVSNLTTASTAAREVAGLGLSRFSDITTASCRWKSTATQVIGFFGRPAMPIVWDFAEAGIFGEQAGDYSVTVGTMARVIGSFPTIPSYGSMQVADACALPLPDQGVGVWFTDPPYYDAIPYSDLSDFFLVWLKRTLPGHPLLHDPFDPTNLLSPKLQEAVQDETKKVNGHPKNRAWFEDTMAKAFAEGRRVLRDDGIGSVVFAHKTTEGWEALLGGLIRGGWTITGSWPISTEMATRLRAATPPPSPPAFTSSVVRVPKMRQ